MGVAVSVGVLVTVKVRVSVGVGVTVGVSVGVGVKVDVSVGVMVGNVPVGVGVTVPQNGCSKMSCSPLLRPPALHSNCVPWGPVPFCTPTVAPPPEPGTVPYMTSKR